MTTTQQTELEKTIGWMRREGVQGDDREVERYARDWLEMRERFGVSLHLKFTGLLPPSPRCTIPTRLSMEREAERIERRRTRTRVMLGHRIWVQAWGDDGGVTVWVLPTDGPESTWEVVPAGRVDNLLFDPETDIRSFLLQAPVRREHRANLRNKIGSMGAWDTVWPSMPELLAWVESQVPEVIERYQDERDPWLKLTTIVPRYGLSEHYDRFLRRLCGDGRIECRKQDRSWQIRQSAIEAWLQSERKRGWPEGRPRHAPEVAG